MVIRSATPAGVSAFARLCHGWRIMLGPPHESVAVFAARCER